MENGVLDMMIKKWARLRKEEAKRIDPENAEVRWWSKGFVDVPGIDIDPEIGEQISDQGEYCFARNPGSDIWLGLGELPRETQRRLWSRRKVELYEASLDSLMDDGSGLTARQWLQVRKDEGERIDPETAEVHWTYVVDGDPYGLGLEVDQTDVQVGRGYFARNPGSEIWVRFGDLPEQTRSKLWEKHSSKLAFPAGLPLRRSET